MKIEGYEKFAALGKDNADAFAKSSAAAVKGFEDLSKSLQALTAKQVEKNDAAVKALLAVKTPAEFADIQGKLARESIEAAIAESRKLAEQTTAAVTAALEPFQARFTALQDLVKVA